jgi:glycerate dehydrogenase
MRAVFLDESSLAPVDLDLSGLKGLFEYYTGYDNTLPEQVDERLTGADVVITNKVVLDEATLAEAGELKLVCVAATGYNNVAVAAAKQCGITVCNVTNYASHSVVEHVFALILGLSRKTFQYRDAVHNGKWNQASQFCLLDFPIGEIAGKTLGIVGYGVLGRAVADAARAFGLDVLVAAHKGQPSSADRVAFQKVIETSDILTLHCPLNEQTRNLIGTSELAAMKQGALLINCARGGIVDEAALADALKSGQLGGAGVDVLTEEPPVHGNPLLDTTIPNLIVTPHIAWASRQARQRLVAGIANNIKAYLSGSPVNVVA